MRNLRPELTELGRKIASDYANDPSISLSERIREYCKKANLNADLTHKLVGITNKQYIELTGNMEFDLANVDEVLYGQPNVSMPKTASLISKSKPYFYPEFASSLYNSGSSMSKSASVSNYIEDERIERDVDITRQLSETINKNYKDVLTKYASLNGQAEHEYNMINEKIGVLNRLGYNKNDLLQKLSKCASLSQTSIKLINSLSDERDYHSSYLDGYEKVFEVDEHIQELSDRLQKFASIFNELKEIIPIYNSVHNDRERLIKVRRVTT
jgi:galactitol-specific phosphotransferase system IIB component